MERRWIGWGALALIAGIVVAVYHDSFHGPFIFDDLLAIRDNPDIHQFATALRESAGTDTATAVGRPLLRVTLWANYAVGGLDVVGYHVFNLVLHLLVAFTLFALLRRLLESPVLEARYGDVAGVLAAAITLLWAVHPLQTESVTYVVQRAEMLGALFYLLTLYGVVRSAEAQTRRGAIGWSVGSVLACLLGMAAKETLATAPLLALAMDRIFFTPSWGQLWRARRGLYLALAGTWIFQALLVASSSGRKGTVGFDLGVSWWEYALTQPYYLCRYLALTLWPQALTLDYGTYLAKTPGDIVPYALAVVLLLGLTGWALWRVPALGFCGLWFFLILAPTSSVVPVVSQTGAEHRMYLPLAALLSLGVMVGYTAACRWWPSRRALQALLAAVALLALILGARTLSRNEEYRTELSLWRTVVDRWPMSARGHDYLGLALASEGRVREAAASHAQAVQLQPGFYPAHNNLGLSLAKLGRLPEAIAQYEQALHLHASYAEAHNNLGMALTASGRVPEAILHIERAIQLRPDFAEAHNNLGIILANTGRRQEAIAHYEEALRLKPEFSAAHNSLGNALAAAGRLPEAIDHFTQALQPEPGFAKAHNNLGSALAKMGRAEEAVAHYRQALQLDPNFAEAYNSLASLLAKDPDARKRNGAEAVRLAQRAVELTQGQEASFLDTLAVAQADAGQAAEAAVTARRALDVARANGQVALAEAIEARMVRDGQAPASAGRP